MFPPSSPPLLSPGELLHVPTYTPHHQSIPPSRLDLVSAKKQRERECRVQRAGEPTSTPTLRTVHVLAGMFKSSLGMELPRIR